MARRGYVHPDALGHGIGKLIATGLEEDAARGDALTVQNAVLEADSPARGLLKSLGYDAVRVFRELRIELKKPRPHRVAGRAARPPVRPRA